ncbi:MAG: hypothetical protein J0653_01110 [Deltaproteobacteria bacterium]|nr:hypothetical protein [Deltaproteobacteria bacterium]
MKKFVVVLLTCLLTQGVVAECRYLPLAYYALGVGDTFTSYLAANQGISVSENPNACGTTMALSLKLGKKHRNLLDKGAAIPVDENSFNQHYTSFRDKIATSILKNAGF